jgi:outer membrane receptor for Fe3+-dicitrate
MGDLTGAFGVFTASSDPGVHYCRDGATTPSTDHFDVASNPGEERTVTAYLVTDTRLTPDGARPDQAFTDLVLQVRNLRNTAYAAPRSAESRTGLSTGSSPPCR